MAKQKRAVPREVVSFLGVMNRIETLLASTFFAIMTLLIVADLLGRELFHYGIPWAQRSAVYLMLWGSFIGVVMSSAKGGHLRPEIADRLWPKKWHPILRALEHVGIALFCILLCKLSWSYWTGTREMGDTDTVLGVPLWITQWVIPYLFFSMSLRHLAYVFFPSLRPAGEYL